MRRRHWRSVKNLGWLTLWLGVGSLLVGCGSGGGAGAIDLGGVNSIAIGNNNTVLTNVGGVMNVGGSGVVDTGELAGTGAGLDTTDGLLRRRGGGSGQGSGCDHGDLPEDFGPGWVSPASPGSSEETEDPVTVTTPGSSVETGGSAGNQPGGSTDISDETVVTANGTVVRGRGGIDETPDPRLDKPQAPEDGPIDPEDPPYQEDWEDSSQIEVEPVGASGSEGVPELG